MNILLVAYPILPEIDKALNPSKIINNCGGGWVQRISASLAENESFSLSYVYCSEKGRRLIQAKDRVKGVASGIKYFEMPEYEKNGENSRYSQEDYKWYEEIVETVKPDVICIFGTENQWQTQQFYMLERLGYVDKTVFWIQGIVYRCAERYAVSVPDKVINGRTLKEYIRKNNIKDVISEMERHGIEEKDVIAKAKHVLTRTDWDKEECLSVNKDVEVHRCNETLRDEFYTAQAWDIHSCERHRVFRNHPEPCLKGFHKMIEAIALVKKEIPDVIVYSTGKDFLHYSFPNTLRLSAYQKYLIKKMKQLGVTENFVFLGNLNASEMIEQYRMANVFVSTSSIENSPNSLGEAMIIGTPCVASEVGGVKTMLQDTGLLYEFDDEVKMAENIIRIFKNDEEAADFSNRARKRALTTHDPVENTNQLIRVFEEIAK